jgi:CheY-like chemotaxis protein
MPAGGKGSTMGCRVLVVDDNRDATDILVQLLVCLGHVAAAAYNGQDALNLLDSFNPAVIVLDMNMPVLNGYQTASIIRARSDGEKFHIIAFTAIDDSVAVAQMVEAGCNATLKKPAPVEQLLQLFP